MDKEWLIFFKIIFASLNHVARQLGVILDGLEFGVNIFNIHFEASLVRFSLLQSFYITNILFDSFFMITCNILEIFYAP